MFRLVKSDASFEQKAMLSAIARTQAIIEFDLDGRVLSANEGFLKIMGYTLDEIVGGRHSMFLDPLERDSADYQEFWNALRNGQPQVKTFKRIGKGGKEIWLQASYTPVLDRNGRPVKVVKIATDKTDEVLGNALYAGQIEAIGKSQAVIEFDLDGTIRTANQNFLDVMGYTLDEVRGRHHRMFVEPAERESEAYRQFWNRLRAGQYQAAEYKRIGKGGKEVWIQASYNPILDRDGKPFRVVKFATDVTEQKLRNVDFVGQIEAIGKSQAVIEFDLDGTIRTANQNFLDAMGYTLDEIRGRHHRMFVEPAERESGAYKEFWDRLRAGQYQAAEYRRIGKGGKEVWIQASYNPILDLNGKPFKVVKFATDVTDQVLARMRAEHVGKLMETVAAGAEELNASVREIASSMTASKDRASETFGIVMAGDRATQQLTEAAQSMGGILDVINNITGQINLLALNATIESARAGEAGKGFAVVANEVKNLAGQAKGATEQISGEIIGIQSISGEVAGALDLIRGAMEQVMEYVSSTAAAVEEQSAVASDMSSNMQRAAIEANSIGRTA